MLSYCHQQIKPEPCGFLYNLTKSLGAHNVFISLMPVLQKLRRAIRHHLSVKTVPCLIPSVVMKSGRLLQLLYRVLVPLETPLHLEVTSAHSPISALLLCLSFFFPQLGPVKAGKEEPRFCLQVVWTLLTQQ